jgi:hypothetical protein
MNIELEGIWKEATVAYSRYYHYPGTCLEKIRKNRRNSDNINGGLTEIRTSTYGMQVYNSIQY